MSDADAINGTDFDDLGSWDPGPFSPTVYVDGAIVGAPIIQASAAIVTSTGAFGTYALAFAPLVWTIAPRVVAWASLMGGSFCLFNLVAVTTTFFQFDLAIFTPAIGAPPAGQTVTIEWVAIGH